MATPYAQYVGDRDPVDVLRESFDAYRELSREIAADMWDRPIAPGKWTIRQVLVHVVQWEMILGLRLRFDYLGAIPFLRRVLVAQKLATALRLPPGVAPAVDVDRADFGLGRSLLGRREGRERLGRERLVPVGDAR